MNTLKLFVELLRAYAAAGKSPEHLTDAFAVLAEAALGVPVQNPGLHTDAGSWKFELDVPGFPGVAGPAFLVFAVNFSTESGSASAYAHRQVDGAEDDGTVRTGTVEQALQVCAGAADA
jgi:hypothetical protein